MKEFKDFIFKYKYIILFCLGIIVLFFRNAYNFKIPNLYAEDGAWYGMLMTNGFKYTILNARSDYFVFILVCMLKIVDVIDVIVFNGNIRYVPYIIAFFSYVFITIVAILPSLTLGKRLNEFGKIFLYFCILLLPMGIAGTEVLGRFLSLHFYMWVITFCLLVYRYDNKERRRFLIVLTDVLLLSLVATFPSVLILILIYALIEMFIMIKSNFYNINFKKNEKRFNWKKIKQALCLETKKFSTLSYLFFCTIVFILAMVIIVKMKHAEPTFEIGGNPQNILNYFVKAICYPFVWPFYEHLNFITGLISLIIIVMFYIGGYFFVEKNSRCFYILSILSFLLIVLVTLVSRFSLTDYLSTFQNNVSDRYFIVMHLSSLIPLAIILSDGIKKRKAGKIIAIVITSYFIIIYCVNYKDIFQFDKNLMPGILETTYSKKLQKSFENNQINEEGTLFIVDIDPSWKMSVPKNRLEKSVILE